MYFRSTFKHVQLKLHEGVIDRATAISRLVNGKMTLSIGALLCYSMLSFSIALVVAKFLETSHPGTAEHLKSSYNNVK